MARPVVSDSAERLYESLTAYAGEDETNGWTLLHMCQAAALMLTKANDALRYDDTGSGWRRMRDPDRAPGWALPWLAKHAGIRELPASLTETQQRVLIRDAPGLRRGTRAALVAAAQRHLTGNQTLIVFERTDGNAYQLTVVTRTDETPDPARVLAALLTQKPAGIILTHIVATGQVWNEAAATTWDAVAPGVTWDDVATSNI